MFFQMTFAIITPALIAGALADRMKYSAFLIFMAAWLLLVYCRRYFGEMMSEQAGIAFGALGVALLLRWLNDEESEALALGFDRLLRPPRSAWPTRTGLR